GWMIGPEVVELLFGREFSPARQVAMLAAGGVMAASTAQIGGQVLVARARTTALAGAWGVGLAVAVVVMLAVSGTPDVRVATGFAGGALAALLSVGFLITGSGPGRETAGRRDARPTGDALPGDPEESGAAAPWAPTARGRRRSSHRLRPARDRRAA